MPATALSPRSLRLPSRLLRAAPDERLVAALRRGDEKAFEAIYDRHHRPLLAFCRHMLGSHEEAEDALQHVFVSAHRHLCEGSAHVNLKPWLYTIARNRCLSVLRARRETLALDDVLEPCCDGLALADEVELGEDLKDMLGDIARLPVNQRAALVLAELGDLTQQEIAAALDVRTDKVKALIFQAREALAGWRQARSASCGEIREQLATLDGSALRRAPLRRHVALCPQCATFEGEVKRQRAAFSLLLPVIPSMALKHSVLTATLSAGHGAGAAGAGGAAVAAASGAGASGLTAKALVVATLAVGAGGGAVAIREVDQHRPAVRPATTPSARTPAAAAPVMAALVVSPPAGARRLGIPAAPHRLAASIDAPGRKAGRGGAQGAPGRSKTREVHGRGEQRSAARSARPERAGLGRPQAAPQRAASKTRPAPATPRRAAVTKPLAAKRKAAPPASVQRRAAAQGRPPG
jgi:RNA polymerase sigma factor (sigma-70 family)